MNKTAIKNFAVWARRKLISEITYKAGLIGITENGILKPLSMSTDNIQFFDIGTGKPTEISDHEIKQREALINRIKEKESTSDYKTAFQFVVEEVAYTWFNRLIAIRFMEVNDYLPSRIRVLSSEIPGKSEPDIVTTPFNTDMVFSAYEKDRIMQLKHENKLDELFRMLFIKQCNKLNEVLPELFEKTADYTEMLLTISFTDSDGMVSHLVNDIDEEDFFEAVEIIGWMYQYYNTEPKDEVFALLKKNVKITKERIPAATQLFTPDWIVRYMVENSLGRLWVEGHPNESLKSEWKYYIEEAEQDSNVDGELQRIREEYRKLKPEDIKIIDPCMGSGHILVYAFDVLMQIYESQGYTQRDAAKSILENNIFGLDIDDRAYQLSYFAVIMKARQYNRRILNKDTKNNLSAIMESNEINYTHLKHFGYKMSADERNGAFNQIMDLIDTFKDAKEYGSIINVKKFNWQLLNSYIEDIDYSGQLSFDFIGIEDTKKQLGQMISVAACLAMKFEVVVTNPPYMGSNGMSNKLTEFTKELFPDAKYDMSTVCMERCVSFCKDAGFVAMINIPVWMFLSSYERLRDKLISNVNIVNMVHFGRGVFGSDFGTTAFIFVNKRIKNYSAVYRKLYLRQGAVDSIEEKERMFFSEIGFFIAKQEDFALVPGNPIAYWVKNKELFTQGTPLEAVANPRQGMKTLNNDYFIKSWFEVPFNKIGFNIDSIVAARESKKKWFPINHGGEFCKYYGNNNEVVNWENDGYEMKQLAIDKYNSITRTITNINSYFKEGITWTVISSASTSFRRYGKGFLFSNSGQSIVPENAEILDYLTGFLNTKVVQYMLAVLAPTLGFESGYLKKISVKIDEKQKELAEEITRKCIEISKNDWDSFETSWDFAKHPFVKQDYFDNEGMHHNGADHLLERIYSCWHSHTQEQFQLIKQYEEELNRIFIGIYDLNDELTPDVEDRDITVQTSMLERDIRSFISYAVGCILGRYSVDFDGIAYAGGEWDENRYLSFKPDKDNCIPITDEEYFDDDICGRFIEFVKCVYGESTLEENLNFIAKALDSKGDTSREILRNYFVKEFYKDHVKTYKKCPIYWLYDSGKQDGFKALVYMHRYNADTTGIVRVDYLHKMQKIYMSEIDRMKEMAENSNNAREVAQAEKRREKLIKQLKETKEYDEKIAHLALSRIAIDLDDGVKVNYDKVQTGQDGKKLEILGKI